MMNGNREDDSKLAKTEKLSLVKTEDGIVHSILEVPAKTSLPVERAVNELRHCLKLDDMVGDLHNVGKLMFVAYYKVKGHNDLQSQVRIRLRSITQLCENSLSTLQEYVRACRYATEKIAVAYHFGLTGFHDIAFEYIKTVCELSQDMKSESENLERIFRDEVEEVKEVCIDTAKKKSEAEEEIGRIEVETAKLRIDDQNDQNMYEAKKQEAIKQFNIDKQNFTKQSTGKKSSKQKRRVKVENQNQSGTDTNISSTKIDNTHNDLTADTCAETETHLACDGKQQTENLAQSSDENSTLAAEEASGNLDEEKTNTDNETDSSDNETESINSEGENSTVSELTTNSEEMSEYEVDENINSDIDYTSENKLEEGDAFDLHPLTVLNTVPEENAAIAENPIETKINAEQSDEVSINWQNDEPNEAAKVKPDDSFSSDNLPTSKNCQIQNKHKKNKEGLLATLKRKTRDLCKKLRRERREREAKVIERIKECDDKMTQLRLEAERHESLLNPLHDALTAIKNLQDVMVQCANFWRETHAVCGQLTNDSMIRILQLVTEIDKSRQENFWRTRTFKLYTIKWSSTWVALQILYEGSGERIMEAKRQINYYLSQAPKEKDSDMILASIKNEFSIQ